MKRKTYLTFEEVKKIVKRNRIKSQSQWYSWAKTPAKPKNVPANVRWVYKKEWISWYDFLGKKPKKFLSYLELVCLMQKLNIKSEAEYYKLDKEKYNLPYNPEQVYKEWNNWSDFLGKDRRDKGRKYKLNHNFFKKWSPDMAYVLGIIFADGYIGDRTVTISLHKDDAYLLDDIAGAVGSSARSILNKDKNCCVLTINSIDMVSDILKIFKCSTKYLRKKLPHIPKKYFADFARGFWDGDGSVWWDKSGKSYRSSLVCFNHKILLRFHKQLKENIPELKGSVSMTIQPKGMFIFGHPLKKDSVLYRLVFRPNDTRRLRDFIYSTDCNLRMKRKYKRFLEAGKICLAPEDRKASYWDYKKAREYIRNLKINGVLEWYKYCTSGEKPDSIPSCPRRIYKEWTGYRDWLGKRKIRTYC